MTIIDIEQRMQAIQAQLATMSTTTAALAGGPVGVAGGPVGASGAAGPGGFAAALASAATGPAPAPGTAGTAATGAAAAGPATTGAAVVATARQYLGVPYHWGGADPASGFDCSGLVQWVFGRDGVTLPRTAAEQARVGTAVSPAAARPGDLLFFGSPVDHVGIYAGNGTMVVAPHTGSAVRVEHVDPASAVAIRRVLPAAGPAATPAWAARLPAAGRPWASALDTAAAAGGVDPRLLAALTWTESGFDPAAVSPAGAVGLTQLMPGTAAGLGVDPADPAANLTGGARYLAQQLARFGDPRLALAAYNAGPSAVLRYGGVPPYAETQAYVQQVLDRYDLLGGTPA